AGAAVAPATLAHHGFGTFVMDEDIEITGTVTGLDFVNPHSWLYLDVVDENGETVAMRCEMRSANTLRRSGWSPDLFPVGEEVTITGSPDRDDPYSCYVSTVIFDDGSSLDRYGQISAPAEIGQGERPLRLANGEPNISGDWAQEQRVMTDPRGQRGTLVPLSEAARYADDPEAAGVIGGARGTEQAAARAEALRLAREGVVESAAEAEAAARAANAAAGGGRGPFGAGGIELTEAGQAALDAREIGSRYDMSCVFTSIVTEWSGDSGEVVNRVIQRGDTITIQYGRLGVERTIHMNMSEHPEGIEPSLTGHSIGRWENDTLIVDTIGFEPGLFNSRTPHSDQLHVTEEFTFDTETRQLRRSFVANDPLYWTEDATGSNATNVSEVPYFSAACEDLTIDEDAELGRRDRSAAAEGR
ncbi:MAG: hypothetical protein JXB36_06470, partial [Gammaproteobacteria bacterium]|nr:hypothetical protein [Gammaproteobacteria bacterium]